MYFLKPAATLLNYTEIIDGQNKQGGWNFNDPTNTMINLCPPNLPSSTWTCEYLTFKIIKHNHIELQDDHGNTVFLFRDEK
jgi:hypothetical protein